MENDMKLINNSKYELQEVTLPRTVNIDDYDNITIDLKDKYDVEIKNNMVYIFKKKMKLPTTYEECCTIKHCDPDFYVDTHLYSNTLGSLYKLLICRDAYWNIAGEELGLEKAWEPVWDESEDLYTVHTFNGEIRLSGTSHRNAILVFPTEEMRNIFYDNFKDLIEKCKELL